MLIANPLNSELAFPILEIFHIAGFAVAIGSTALVDFRVLNIGMTNQSPKQIAQSMNMWMLVGLVVAIFAGLLLFSTDPDMYYENISFLFKMILLVAAIVFNYTIHRRMILSDVTSGTSKFIACVSIILWTSVIFGGIFIAFVPTL